jgi:hypothetical protein
VDDNGDLYELSALTRTKFKRSVDHVYFPDMATEELYNLTDLESDVEKLNGAFQDLKKLSRYLIKPTPSLGSVVE